MKTIVVNCLQVELNQALVAIETFLLPCSFGQTERGRLFASTVGTLQQTLFRDSVQVHNMPIDTQRIAKIVSPMGSRSQEPCQVRLSEQTVMIWASHHTRDKLPP